MATSGVDGLEKMESEGEKAPLLESGASQLSVSTRRRVCLDRCFSLITILCAVLFPLLGASILALGAQDAGVVGGAYVGGGTAELVLGVCLVLRLVYQLLRRTPGDTSLVPRPFLRTREEFEISGRRKALTRVWQIE